MTPDKAVDGSPTTRWSSSFTDNQWWQVDLGAPRTIDTVAINWETAYASEYKVQTSLNGVTFSDQATVTNTAPGLKATSFTPVSARYVRVLGVTRATGYGISFWEAEVYGANLALGKPATSSSNEDSTLTPDKAVDGLPRPAGFLPSLTTSGGRST